MKKIEKRIALVTGGNRGIGFEVCRELAQLGLSVILTARDSSKGERASAQLNAELGELGKKNGGVAFVQLDVTDDGSVERAAQWVREKFGRLDVLVNNAGVFMDTEDRDEREDGGSIFTVEIDRIRQTLETNTYGPIRMAKSFVPLMRAHGYGRIVNVSSGMGQLSEMNRGYPGYRISKTALNAVTRILADELKDTGILVNSVCPGWVRTDMGGPNAERTVQEGADTLVWLATLPDDGPSGVFFRDRERIEW